MKRVLVTLGIVFGWASIVWAGDPATTLESNKAAIDAVQTNADYVWTLAAGIFNIGGTTAKIIGVQLLGIGACFLWVFPAAFLMFKLIDMTVKLRVSPEEEMKGLDFTEHAGTAYPDFTTQSHDAGYSYTGGSDGGSEKPSIIGAAKPATS